MVPQLRHGFKSTLVGPLSPAERASAEEFGPFRRPTGPSRQAAVVKGEAGDITALTVTRWGILISDWCLTTERANVEVSKRGPIKQYFTVHSVRRDYCG